MNDQKNEQEFVEAVKGALDESLESLDGQTLFRLNQARTSAMASHGRSWNWRLLRLPAGAVLVASVVMMLGSFLLVGHSSQPPTLKFEELEIVSVAESPEFFEDLDFYIWLAEEVENAS